MQDRAQIERLFAKYGQPDGPKERGVSAVSPGGTVAEVATPRPQGGGMTQASAPSTAAGASASVAPVEARGKAVVEYTPSGYSAKLGIAPQCDAPEAGAERMADMLRRYPLHVYRLWSGGCGFGFSQGWARDNWNRVMEFHDLFWSEAGDVYFERHRSEIPVMDHDAEGGLRRCAHA